MYSSSAYRILYLLNLLSKKDYTKNELIEEFEKKGIKLSSSTVSLYINKLVKNGVNISILKEKNRNVYHFQRIPAKLDLSEEELSILYDVKKLLFTQKDHNKIRKVIRLFYKLAFVSKNEEIKSGLLDFGYYSSINWPLVRILEKHCREKNIIQLDYILPKGENKKLIIHLDDIRIGDWSNKIYLWGAFEGSNYLSYLPFDKIYMVEKVIQKNVPFDSTITTLTYKISRKLYDDIQLNSKENLVELNDKFAVISRPLEDNFYIIQRLMSFCPDLYYISDENIKNKVKEKLSILKASYDKEFDK